MSVKKRWPVYLMGALILWAMIYTAAYRGMEARVKAFESQLEDVSRRHDTLLTYVITLREQLAKTGFQVPPMPPMEKQEEQDDEANGQPSKEDPM